VSYAWSMLAQGELAPDFDVPAHDGTHVKLSDLKGKYVLLWFYPMADTPG
jgi:thioredoxin-dependent peroxiredoxin